MSGSEDLISKDKRNEQAFLKRLRAPVVDPPIEGKCEECGKPLASPLDAIHHFETEHRIPGDVVWVEE